MENSVPHWYAAAAKEHFDALYAGGSFASSRAAAIILGYGKTASAEFMRWFRQNWNTQTESVIPEVTESLSVSDKTKTWTDERSGTIFTDLGDYGIISFTQGEFRAIKRDYSRHYGGKALTRQEIALQYSFPTIKAFELFARVHELRQNGIPFTDTELVGDGVDALVDKTIESRRQEFFLKLSSREQETMRLDASKWRALEVNMRLIASELRGMAASPVRLQTPPIEPDPFIAVLNLQDVHMGKLAHDLRGKRTYDRREARRRFDAATQYLLEQVVGHGQPEAIELIVGGDLYHTDGPAMTTTRGTAQAGQSDGNYREIITEGVAMVMDQIRAARVIAPVRVKVVYGNHDLQSCMMTALLLQYAFEGDARVEVLTQDDGGVITNYGDTTLLVIHGENLKEVDAYRVICNAAQEAGLPIQPNKILMTGHRHHEKLVDLNGVELHQCASLSDADTWHKSAHFTGAAKRASALIIDREGGKSAIFYTKPSLLKSA